MTLGMIFHVSFNVCFRFAPIVENLTAQSTGNHRGIGGRVQIPDVVASSPTFSRPAMRAPWRAHSSAVVIAFKNNLGEVETS